jgi:hypothetical protein
MKIKPANHYSTRTGRRAALVLYSPAVLVGVALGALLGAVETFLEFRAIYREVWAK